MTVGVTLNYDIEEYLQIISRVHKIRRLVFSWILDVVTPIPSQFSPVLKLLYRVNYKWAMVYIFLIFFNLIFGSKASNTQCGGDFSFGQGLLFLITSLSYTKFQVWIYFFKLTNPRLIFYPSYHENPLHKYLQKRLKIFLKIRCETGRFKR